MIPSSSVNGQVTVSSSPTVVSSAVDGAVAIVIRALSANSAKVYVGDLTVSSSTGYELAAGEAVALSISNPHRIYVVGTASDKVSYIITKR